MENLTFKEKQVSKLDAGEYFWYQKQYCRLVNKADATSEWSYARCLKTEKQIKLYIYWEVNHSLDQGNPADVPTLTPEEEARLSLYVKDHSPTEVKVVRVDADERMIQV